MAAGGEMNCKQDFVCVVDVKVTTRQFIKWPFDGMSVGDSFLVPEGVKRVSIGAAMQRAEKAGKGMFVSRTIEGQVRVWRFA